ncbi:MAG: SusC/RagA family TonB-linked outer membrane protein [Flavisolibacter sp.]
MRKLLLAMLGFLFFCTQLLAQNKTITGRVTDEKGVGIPNASINVKGTRNGTTADAEGNFSLTVVANAQVLEVSSLSYEPQEVSIRNSNAVSITLSTRNQALNEVVVTSLGITRDKRSLGYATQTVRADQLADRGQVNVVNALQGKLAGVNITGASGSPGASTNINIRGISSFTGSNQPLFIVDGIPISNDVDRTNGGPLGTLGDNQPPNRALDLDLNNIESVNVLKGPAASVLYGSRAAAGAIIITTKKGGTAGGKAQIILNSSYSIQNVTGLPEVQNQYGQGLNGIFDSTSGFSWGPKFGTTPTIANGLLVNGAGVNYKAYPNNIKDFYQRGTIADNSLTINGGDQKQNYTFSIGNLTQNGILPNTSVNRTSVKFGANTLIRDRIRLGGSATFINTLQNGILGGNGNSAIGVLAALSRSIDLTGYKNNGTYKNLDGTNNFPLPSTDNPYFDAFENPLRSKLYRILGNITLGYDFNSWLSVTYRLGIDAYTDRRKQIYAISAAFRPAGQVLDNDIYRSELNGDLIISAKKNDFFLKDLTISALVGQNLNQRNFQSVTLQGDNLAIPGFYNSSNATVFTNGSGENTVLRRLLGFYGQLSFAYHNYLFLELTGRADKSSTLPVNKNTFFYPSINAGFVFTDAFKLNSRVLSYGKIRASATKVGRDAEPYLLSNTYGSSGFGNNVASFNFPYGSIAGFGISTRIAPATLSPEFTTSYEAGLNLGFLKNRLSIDLAYFDEDSKSQIINVGIAPSTGFNTKTTNIGELTNKGLEALVNVSVIAGKSFNWDVSGNFTKITNRVVSIAPGTDNFQIPGSAFIGSVPSIKVGYPYGVIIGGAIPKSPDNSYLINPATGTFQSNVAGQVLSNPNPEYQLGFTSNFKYKGFSLSSTFSFTKGGQILSFTSALYKARGVWIKTAEGRDQPHILPGEIQVGDKYIPNNIQIPAQTYWQALGGLQSEFNVYDATNFRLREVLLGYDIPSSISSRLKINSMRLSIFANNVFFIAPNAIIDPEVNTQGAGNIRGLELQSAPNARTIGASLRISL